MLLQNERHVWKHALAWTAAAEREGEARARDRALIEQRLPSSLEGGYIQLFSDREPALDDVAAFAGRQRALEQHELLHLRERERRVRCLRDHWPRSSSAAGTFAPKTA